MVKFAHSTSAAQGFAGLDPGHGHGTDHQAMPRWYHIKHNQRHSQLEYKLYTGGFGEKTKKKKKGRLATDVSSGANL